MGSYEQNISLSYVAPIIWNLKNKHLQLGTSEGVIRQLKIDLAIALTTRFEKILDVGSIHMKACLLDPRY
jgi:hypothetical protein